jgi:4-amino-4-deoxy-L-arabinose transferase-like glycosyltransferase
MSETWFIACMLSSIYLFQLGIINLKTKWIVWGFILVGYTFLVRPVAGVMLPIVLLLLLINPHFSKNKKHVFIASLCFIVFPIIQSGFNKVVYNTWTLREGFSWNLWNRVVNEDGYNPNLSEATAEMKVRLKDPNFVAKGEHWWDITSQLSYLGMQPKEIQAYCMRICFDGIKANPGTYFETSFKRGLLILPIEIQESICIYSSPNEYAEFLKNYTSRHHQPFLDDLNKQEIGHSTISKFGIKLYSYWNSFFLKLNNQSLYIALYVSLLILGLIEIRSFFKYRKLDPIILLFILLPIAMSLAACSLEVLHNRYYLPGIVLEFMAVVIVVNKFNQFKIISSKK